MKTNKKITIIAIASILVSLVLLAVVVALFSVIEKRFIFNGKVILTWFTVILVIVALWLVNKKTNIGKQALKANSDLENTHFLTTQEIKQNKGLTVTKFSKLAEVVDGMPISASVDRSKKDVDVIFAEPISSPT